MLRKVLDILKSISLGFICTGLLYFVFGFVIGLTGHPANSLGFLSIPAIYGLINGVITILFYDRRLRKEGDAK